MTGLLSTSGGQFRDWTAAYRVFSRERFDPETVFDAALAEVVGLHPPGNPLVVAVDDSLLRKRGTKTPGVAFRRDPLGPAFHTNFIRAQRVLQVSAAVPSGAGKARMVPVDFMHAPTPARPRSSEGQETWQAYRNAQKASRLSCLAQSRLVRLRTRIDTHPNGPDRVLVAVGDGGYTNRTVLRGLPKRTVFIGRIRADAKLYQIPTEPAPRKLGRKPIYGAPLPTPDQIRADSSYAWQTVPVYAAGRWHDLRVKTISPVRWRASGAIHDLRLVVVAPLAYRPRRKARLLYRNPAYLICTDPTMPLNVLLQSYIWRWDIEVNFRDEKTLLGVGQAQVRAPASVQSVPALIVAAYSMLLLAAGRAFGHTGVPDCLPQPKWRIHSRPLRATTLSLLQHLRAELWGRALGVRSFSNFAAPAPTHTNSQELPQDLASAVLYASQ